jgi:hypothetical protein
MLDSAFAADTLARTAPANTITVIWFFTFIILPLSKITSRRSIHLASPLLLLRVSSHLPNMSFSMAEQTFSFSKGMQSACQLFHDAAKNGPDYV